MTSIKGKKHHEGMIAEAIAIRSPFDSSETRAAKYLNEKKSVVNNDKLAGEQTWNAVQVILLALVLKERPCVVKLNANLNASGFLFKISISRIKFWTENCLK